MKKLLILLLISNLTFGQDIKPLTNKKDILIKGYNTNKYSGYKAKIGIGILRLRTFGRDNIQLTYIIGKEKQIRFYVYYDVYDNQFTNAISLRYFL